MIIESQQKIINTIIQILKEIDRRDYEIPKSRGNSSKNTFHDEFSTYENNFVSKFNEKYALAEFQGIAPNQKELQKQLQIPKKYIYSEHNDPIVKQGFEKLANELGVETNGRFEFETIPDFFIHKDQNDRLSKNQKLIIEFKTEKRLPKNRFMWDFFKLNLYLEKYNFQTACFVCINNDSKYIINLLYDYLQKEHYLSTHIEKLHIMIQKDYDSKIEVFNIKSLIEHY